ncbi:hypothetical protein C8Q70DRAFT_390879 [Cubamyces menziesii]|nr:hypothetical protein C8Q70DRAFT_390879 [Cubamyces menziesii]
MRWTISAYALPSTVGVYVQSPSADAIRIPRHGYSGLCSFLRHLMVRPYPNLQRPYVVHPSTVCSIFAIESRPLQSRSVTGPLYVVSVDKQSKNSHEEYPALAHPKHMSLHRQVT